MVVVEAADQQPASDDRIWYHGTTAAFDDFQSQSESHLGFHFGTRAQAARIIGRKPGGHIDAYHLVFQNPLRTTDAGDWSNPFQAWAAINKALGGPREVHLSALFPVLIDQTKTRQERLAVIRQKVEDAGYDAILYKNRIEGTGDSVIVFRNSQITRLGGLRRDDESSK